MTLLDPSQRVVAFTGRDAEIADLLTWCEDRARAGVRLVTGRGGVGKSRLAAELVRRLSPRRWRVVTVRPGQEPGAVAEACRKAGPGRRVLVVADDADTVPGLAHVVDAAIGAARGKVRLLLLARTGRSWWDELRWESEALARPWVAASQTNLLNPRPPEPYEIAAAFAERLGVPIPPVTLTEVRTESAPPLPGLAEDPWPVPLELHAGMLASVLAGPDGAVVVDPACGVADLLDRERERWRASASAAGLPAEQADDAVAAALLAGAVDPTLLRSVAPGMARADGIAWLEGLGMLPGPERCVPSGAVELHAARCVAARPGFVDRVLVAGAPSSAVFRMAVLASCLDMDLAGVPRATARTMGRIARVAELLSDDAEVLSTVRRLLPASTGGPVAEAVLQVAEREADAVTDPVRRVAASLAAAVAWSGIDTDRAAVLAEQAAQDARALFDQEPARHRPLFARARRLVGAMRGIVGNPRAADRSITRALELCDGASPADAFWLTTTRGQALVTGIITAYHLGHSGVVIERQRQAVEVMRVVAAVDPVVGESDYAMALGNSLALIDYGLATVTLADTRKAVALQRRLAAARPELHEDRLAMYLSNLSHAATALGLWDEAMAAGEESLQIRRRLAPGNPGLRWELAWSLSSLGSLYSGLGLLDEAATLEVEAVAIRRELTARHPGRYAEMLATSLSNLGVTFSRQHRFDDALAAELEATEIRRGLAADIPERFAQHLARSLTNLSVRYDEAGLPGKSLAPAEEAVAILRPLADRQPTRFLPDLADALTNLGATLTDLGCPDEAVTPAAEAVDAYRRLGSDPPPGHRAALARGLTNLAAALHAAGRSRDALPFATEAVVLRQVLASGASAGSAEMVDLRRSSELEGEIRGAAARL